VHFNTPLRYPGGKGRLTQFVANLLEANDLVGGQYVEPYAGGAGIGVSLLMLEYVQKVHINDINPSIHAFWASVLDDTEAICRRIFNTRVTMAEWRRQRDIQCDPDASRAELAFSTFFLNRTNRSGIILGGVIGGKRQCGDWKLDARYNKQNLIHRIERIAQRRHRIVLYRKDAAVLIRDVLPKLTQRALVYLDPPYYSKGRQLYEDRYTANDHTEIAALTKTIKQQWMVSYDNVRAIRELYKGYRQRRFALNYSANTRHAGSEVLIFGDRLSIPRCIHPSRGNVR